ncbi:MAG: DUF3332 domain-containing protein [Muribaculaceae bacterium]|nr:DUF3332 domain-containing protein [Muribaculaceae bacterium]
MKKYQVAVGAILLAGSSMAFTSCIGSFALTNRVLAWNKQVGSKFVNELVFFAFWVLPVYEVTSLADLFVVNSIEFWSGTNPVTASTQVVDTENGRYIIDRDAKGYTITLASTGEKTRLEFLEDTQTWAVEGNDGELIPFMTFVDDNHVKMVKPDGDFQLVNLSEQGVMAYSAACGMTPMAMR